MKRYFIKAYPMHEAEEAACRSAKIDDAVYGPSFVEGIADEATIQEMTKAGIVVQAFADADAAPDPGDTKIESPVGAPAALSSAMMRGTPSLGLGAPPRAETAQPYILVELRGSITDRMIQTLADIGAEIIERDPSGYYVVRADSGTAPLRALRFVGAIRNYGISETIDGTGELAIQNPLLANTQTQETAALRGTRTQSKKRRSAVFDAILHRREDQNDVIEALRKLGAQIVTQSTRSVRFTLNKNAIEQAADIPGIASVAPTRPPGLFHDIARTLIKLDSGAPAVSFPYDGAGELVGVADTGIDDVHPDFQGRIHTAVALGRPGDSSDPDGHGTHVAGSILGNGSKSNHALAGMAPKANLYFQSVLDANGGLGGLPNNLNMLFQPAYTAGVRVHNNSWGAYLQARYDSMAIEVDEFVWDHPDFLPVIAAGNEGSCKPFFHAMQGYVDFPSLGSPATAKNGLTVGASRNKRNQHGLSTLKWGAAWPKDFPHPPIATENVSGDDQALAAFSSRGPCEDMRIKPDIVAPGTDIASTRSKNAPLGHFWGAYPGNAYYAFMGGTSMACPIVAGCAALTRQYYRQGRLHDAPSAALLKATLINGTDELTGRDAKAPLPGFPNYHQGFGRVNMATTLPDPTTPTFVLEFADTWNRDPSRRFDQRQGRRRWRIKLTNPGPLRICLAWTDPPAKGLQNALRMILDDATSKKWIANDKAAAPIRFAAHDPRVVLPGNSSVVTRDSQNNVQVIREDAAQAGSYTLAIFADCLLKPPQDFALVVTGPLGLTWKEI